LNQIYFSTLNIISVFCSLQGSAYKGNPDLRQQKHIPEPPIEEIEKELFLLLPPNNFNYYGYMRVKTIKKLHDRILSLSVTMALVLSLVYRQILGLTEREFDSSYSICLIS
jgi:hypothetical protein